MSKLIKLTDEHKRSIKEEFLNFLSGIKLADGGFKFNKSFKSIDAKANLYFTEKAWLKMQALIHEFDSEVAWHGLAHRIEDSDENEYCITDILIYPQMVTGATVETDQKEYEEWLMGQDDEIFNNIRMQGHSHVSMGVSPSSTDLEHQQKILAQLDDDMFYIFVIWNKHNDRTIKIYDMSKNILFETSDVDVDILYESDGIIDFVEDAKLEVRKRVYNYQQHKKDKISSVKDETKEVKKSAFKQGYDYDYDLDYEYDYNMLRGWYDYESN